MSLHLKSISEKIVETSPSYWPGFSLVAYAFYDREKVYLYNHPKYGESEQIAWNDKFSGSTLILFEEYPTAIVNLDVCQGFEEAYSLACHELFHGFQYLNAETRFPNETLGMTYPLIAENVELRGKERHYLYMAVLSSSGTEKLTHLSKFIQYREMRRGLINPYLDFELAIETIEGPAFYVEFQAYREVSSLSYEQAISNYGSDLLDNEGATVNLRKSCYSSGLFLCLLLDETCPDWKSRFFATSSGLYDLVKEVVMWERVAVEQVEVSSETLTIMEKVFKNKQTIFGEFEAKNGFHLYIVGDITSRGYDPMNIIVDEKRLLHKNFLKVFIDNREYHCSLPVLAYYEEPYKTIEKLHTVLTEKPVDHNGIIYVRGLGDIKGQFKQVDGIYYIFV